MYGICTLYPAYSREPRVKAFHAPLAAQFLRHCVISVET